MTCGDCGGRGGRHNERTYYFEPCCVCRGTGQITPEVARANALRNCLAIVVLLFGVIVGGYAQYLTWDQFGIFLLPFFLFGFLAVGITQSIGVGIVLVYCVFTRRSFDRVLPIFFG